MALLAARLPAKPPLLGLLHWRVLRPYCGRLCYDNTGLEEEVQSMRWGAGCFCFWIYSFLLLVALKGFWGFVGYCLWCGGLIGIWNLEFLFFSVHGAFDTVPFLIPAKRVREVNGFYGVIVF
jgi:hypothetical protein